MNSAVVWRNGPEHLLWRGRTISGRRPRLGDLGSEEVFLHDREVTGYLSIRPPTSDSVCAIQFVSMFTVGYENLAPTLHGYYYERHFFNLGMYCLPCS